jgi:hypothetical protein
VRGKNKQFKFGPTISHFSNFSGKQRHFQQQQTIRTPHMKVKTLTTENVNEFSRSHFTNAPLYRNLSVNNFSINGRPIGHDGSTCMSPLQLPDEVLKAMGNSKNFRLKIFERSYDISIDEGVNNHPVPFKQVKQKKFSEKLDKGNSDESDSDTQTKHASKLFDTKVEVKLKSESDNEGKKKQKSSKSLVDKPQPSTGRFEKSKSFSEGAAFVKMEGKGWKKPVEVKQEAKIKAATSPGLKNLKRPSKELKAGGVKLKKIRKRVMALPSSSSDDEDFQAEKTKRKVVKASKTTLDGVMNENVVKKKPAPEQAALKPEKAEQDPVVLIIDSSSDDHCMSPQSRQRKMEMKHQSKSEDKKDLKATFDGKENKNCKKKTDKNVRLNKTIIDSSGSSD